MMGRVRKGEYEMSVTDQGDSNGVAENWLVLGIVLNLELMGSPVMCEEEKKESSK